MNSQTTKPRHPSNLQPAMATTSHTIRSNLTGWFKRNALTPTILVASGPSLLQADLDLLLRLRINNQLPVSRRQLAEKNPVPAIEAATAEPTEQRHPNPIVAVVSDCYRLASWADLLYSSDAKWWNHHRPQFSGEKWTTKRIDKLPGAVTRVSDKAIKELSLRHVPGKHLDGLSFNSGFIHFGGNSGFQLLNLAILAGAKNIGLLGYDMKVPAGNPEQEHFFGKHPKGFNSPVRNFKNWIRQFDIAASQVKKTDIRVANLTRDTALTCFPRMTIETFFNE